MDARQFSIALGDVDDKFVTEALMYQCSPQSTEHKTHPVFNRFNSSSKQIAAVAAVVILFSSAMSVSAIREPIIEMIKTLFSNHVELSFEGHKKYKIKEIYGISEIPAGFEPTLELTNNAAVFRDYENPDGHIISFSQMITGNDTTVDVDNENATCQTTFINDVEVYIAWGNRGEVVSAFWAADGYTFNLTYFGEIKPESLIELIKSIEVVGIYTDYEA